MLCAIWGSTWLVIKIGLQGAPPLLAASLRFVVAAAVLLVVCVVFRSKLPRGRTEWALVAFYGIVLFGADYGLIYWGEGNQVDSGLSAVLFATFPFQTAIAAHALLKTERLSAQKLVGIALGFAGIAFIFRTKLAASADLFFPMLAIVLAATCAAAASVAVKRWGHDMDPVSLTAASLGAREAWAVPSWPTGILAIVYLSLAGSVVAFVAYLWLLKRIEATSLSYIAFVNPVVAVLLGFLVGEERLDPLVLAGAGMTLAGIWLATSKRVGAWIRVAMGARVVTGNAADPPEKGP
jgi:drug/metabolite transporter (DMT)-like permease